MAGGAQLSSWILASVTGVRPSALGLRLCPWQGAEDMPGTLGFHTGEREWAHSSPYSGFSQEKPRWRPACSHPAACPPGAQVVFVFSCPSGPRDARAQAWKPAKATQLEGGGTSLSAPPGQRCLAVSKPLPRRPSLLGGHGTLPPCRDLQLGKREEGHQALKVPSSAFLSVPEQLHWTQGTRPFSGAAHGWKPTMLAPRQASTSSSVQWGGQLCPAEQLRSGHTHAHTRTRAPPAPPQPSPVSSLHPPSRLSKPRL